MRHWESNPRIKKERAASVRIALLCTLSQNGYGAPHCVIGVSSRFLLISGDPFWGSFLGILFEDPFWGSFLGVLSGGPFWGSFLGVLSEVLSWDPLWGYFLGIPSGAPRGAFRDAFLRFSV